MNHFDPNYTERVLTVAKLIGLLNVNEVNALHECLQAQYSVLDAEASRQFLPGDRVKFTFLKGKRKTVYKEIGLVTKAGPMCEILTSTGARWTIPSRMIEKLSPLVAATEQK